MIFSPLTSSTEFQKLQKGSNTLILLQNQEKETMPSRIKNDGLKKLSPA